MSVGQVASNVSNTTGGTSAGSGVAFQSSLTSAGTTSSTAAANANAAQATSTTTTTAATPGFISSPRLPITPAFVTSVLSSIAPQGLDISDPIWAKMVVALRGIDLHNATTVSSRLTSTFGTASSFNLAFGSTVDAVATKLTAWAATALPSGDGGATASAQFQLYYGINSTALLNDYQLKCVLFKNFGLYNSTVSVSPDYLSLAVGVLQKARNTAGAEALKLTTIEGVTSLMTAYAGTSSSLIAANSANSSRLTALLKCVPAAWMRTAGQSTSAAPDYLRGLQAMLDPSLRLGDASTVPDLANPVWSDVLNALQGSDLVVSSTVLQRLESINNELFEALFQTTKYGFATLLNRRVFNVDYLFHNYGVKSRAALSVTSLKAYLYDAFFGVSTVRYLVVAARTVETTLAAQPTRSAALATMSGLTALLTANAPSDIGGPSYATTIQSALANVPATWAVSRRLPGETANPFYRALMAMLDPARRPSAGGADATNPMDTGDTVEQVDLPATDGTTRLANTATRVLATFRDFAAMAMGRDPIAKALTGKVYADLSAGQKTAIDSFLAAVGQGMTLPDLVMARSATPAEMTTGITGYTGALIPKGVLGAFGVVSGRATIFISSDVLTAAGLRPQGNAEFGAVVREEMGEYLAWKIGATGVQLAPGDVGARLRRVLKGFAIDAAAYYTANAADTTYIRIGTESISGKATAEKVSQMYLGSFVPTSLGHSGDNFYIKPIAYQSPESRNIFEVADSNGGTLQSVRIVSEHQGIFTVSGTVISLNFPWPFLEQKQIDMTIEMITAQGEVVTRTIMLIVMSPNGVPARAVPTFYVDENTRPSVLDYVGPEGTTYRDYTEVSVDSSDFEVGGYGSILFLSSGYTLKASDYPNGRTINVTYSIPGYTGPKTTIPVKLIIRQNTITATSLSAGMGSSGDTVFINPLAANATNRKIADIALTWQQGSGIYKSITVTSPANKYTISGTAIYLATGQQIDAGTNSITYQIETLAGQTISKTVNLFAIPAAGVPAPAVTTFYADEGVAGTTIAVGPASAYAGITTVSVSPATTGTLSGGTVTLPALSYSNYAGGVVTLNVTYSVAGYTPTTTFPVTIQLRKPAERPVLAESAASVTIAQGTSSTDAFYTPELIQNPVRNSTITWRKGGADAAAIRFVDAAKGMVALVNAATYATKSSYSFWLEADNGFGVARMNVTLTIRNPAAVVFTGGDSVDLDVMEGATDFSYVPSVSNNTGAQYALTGADASKVSFNPTTRTVTFPSARDYESPQDTNQDNVYEFDFVATMNGVQSVQHVRIRVVNLSEIPSITSASSATFTEKTLGVAYTATASALPAGKTRKWSLFGAHAGLLIIDIATGQVRFKKVPKVSAATGSARNVATDGDRDTNGNSVFSFTVVADDGDGAVWKEVKLTLTKNLLAPTITSTPPAGKAETGSADLFLRAATNPVANTLLQWSIIGDDADDMVFDTRQRVAFRSRRDYERPTDKNEDNIYEFTLVAYNGQAYDYLECAVAVLNRPDKPPTFSNSSVKITHSASRGLAFYTPVITSELLSESVFEVLNKPTWLNCDPANGALSCSAVPAAGTYTISLRINSANEGSRIQAVILTIVPDTTVVADAPISISSRMVSLNTTSNLLTTFTVDGSSSTVSPAPYSFAVSDPRMWIEKTATSLLLKLRDGAILNRVTTVTIPLLITLIDAAGIVTTKRVTLRVRGDPAPSAISLSNASVAEGVDSALIGNIVVTDDTGDTHNFTVSEGEGKICRFEVLKTDPATGAALSPPRLRLRPGMVVNYETEKAVLLWITATDQNGNTTTKAIALSITNANEAPTDIFLSKLYLVSGNTNDYIQVKAYDSDEGDVPTISVLSPPNYVYSGGVLKRTGGALVAGSSTNTETITLRATDSAGNVKTKSFEITLLPTAASVALTQFTNDDLPPLIGDWQQTWVTQTGKIIKFGVQSPIIRSILAISDQGRNTLLPWMNVNESNYSDLTEITARLGHGGQLDDIKNDGYSDEDIETAFELLGISNRQITAYLLYACQGGFGAARMSSMTDVGRKYYQLFLDAFRARIAMCTNGKAYIELVTYKAEYALDEIEDVSSTVFIWYSDHLGAVGLTELHGDILRTLRGVDDYRNMAKAMLGALLVGVGQIPRTYQFSYFGFTGGPHAAEDRVFCGDLRTVQDRGWATVDASDVAFRLSDPTDVEYVLSDNDVAELKSLVTLGSLGITTLPTGLTGNEIIAYAQTLIVELARVTGPDDQARRLGLGPKWMVPLKLTAAALGATTTWFVSQARWRFFADFLWMERIDLNQLSPTIIRQTSYIADAAVRDAAIALSARVASQVKFVIASVAMPLLAGDVIFAMLWTTQTATSGWTTAGFTLKNLGAALGLPVLAIQMSRGTNEVALREGADPYIVGQTSQYALVKWLQGTGFGLADAGNSLQIFGQLNDSLPSLKDKSAVEITTKVLGYGAMSFWGASALGIAVIQLGKVFGAGWAERDFAKAFSTKGTASLGFLAMVCVAGWSAITTFATIGSSSES